MFLGGRRNPGLLLAVGNRDFSRGDPRNRGSNSCPLGFFDKFAEQIPFYEASKINNICNNIKGL